MAQKSIRKSELKKLESIIVKLEIWQSRNSSHDQAGDARAAKDRLMSLLGSLERRS